MANLGQGCNLPLSLQVPLPIRDSEFESFFKNSFMPYF